MGYNGRRGSNQSALRDHNVRLILQLIRSHGELTKAEATRLTGLSANAVSMIFRSLEADGLLLRGEPDRGKIGQPSIPVRINPAARYYLGLKIGRRTFDLVLMDFVGNVLASETEHHMYPTPPNCIAFAQEAITTLLKRARLARKRVSGFGVAMPYELWHWTDEFIAPPEEMDAWRDFDVASALGKLGPWHVLVENDGTAACGGELTFGAHADKQDFIYFFVGTLIGGGIVLNSNVFRGRRGTAGGFGPLRIPGWQPGRDRLMDHSSIFLLENSIQKCGSDPHAIWRGEMAWDEHSELVDAWINGVARGLAYAAISTLAIIDFEAVVVDGAFPAKQRSRIVQRMEKELDAMDLQGVSRPEILEGSWGALARAVGAATLPLAAKYSMDFALLSRG